jgi:acyl-CoA synthetase (AMP-forming)/AMP-acid ligase II
MAYDYYDVLTAAARQWPNRLGLLAEQIEFTYGEIDDKAERIAAALYGAGIRPRDRVALCLGTDPEWVFAFFALSRLRASAVMLSPAWQEFELAHAWRLTEPVGVITDAPKAAIFDQIGRPGLAVLVGSDEVSAGWTPFVELTADGAGVVPADVAAIVPDDLELALPFSSGTTGAPKAVRHSHKSLSIATHQWRTCLDLSTTDRLQAVTPLSHILGIVNIGATFEAGATIRLFRKFSPRTMVESFEADRITVGMTVAPIAAALAGMADLESFRLDSLRYLNWSATPVNPEIAKRVSARTGIGWLPAYGTTEVPVLAVNPVSRVPHGRLDSVGLPPDGVHVETIDPATGEFLPRGATGEIVALSPAAMKGYLPLDTPSPFLEGGWYRTGDIGIVEPDGWVVITDRLKELIRVSGYQVSPVEVESLLATSPFVRDCAVFGVPDERRGEAPVAAVVPAEGWTANADEIISWLEPQLAPYKKIREVYFVDAIPRTPSGKIQRRLLRVPPQT